MDANLLQSRLLTTLQTIPQNYQPAGSKPKYGIVLRIHYEFHVDPLDVCFGANQLFQPNIISSSQNGGEEEDNFDRAAHVAALCLRDFQ